MKAILFAGLLFSFHALAKAPSLYVKEGAKLLDVEQLIADGEDIQSVYGFENFCYQGNADSVVQKIRSWNKKGSFFSGDGGGFVLRKMTILRGIVTYDISMKFEDEVVPGEFTTVNVKPCLTR